MGLDRGTVLHELCQQTVVLLMGLGYYDQEGKPLGLMEWAMLYEDTDARNVRITEVPGGVIISTVWIGLDMNLRGYGPPLIFESMAFKLDENGYMGESIDQDRYSTRRLAEWGHDVMVQKWKLKAEARG